MTNTLIQLSALIEAFLFAKGSPVSLTDMAKAVGEDSQMIEKALTLLSEKYEKPDSGLTLHHTGAGYMLATKKKYDTWLSSLLGKQTPLSAAALETLAVVACKEPVTRVEIEKIRGVTAGLCWGSSWRRASSKKEDVWISPDGRSFMVRRSVSSPAPGFLM